MPNVSLDEIYYQKFWSLSAFRSETHVKTVEQVYSINKNFETCQLLNKENIEKHLKDVTLPEEWTLDEVQPQPPPQHILLDTNFINQTRDGTVRISFDRQ